MGPKLRFELLWKYKKSKHRNFLALSVKGKVILNLNEEKFCIVSLPLFITKLWSYMPMRSFPNFNLVLSRHRKKLCKALVHGQCVNMSLLTPPQLFLFIITPQVTSVNMMLKRRKRLWMPKSLVDNTEPRKRLSSSRYHVKNRCPLGRTLLTDLWWRNRKAKIQ